MIMQDCAGVLIGKAFHHAGFIILKASYYKKLLCQLRYYYQLKLRRTIHRSVILLNIFRYSKQYENTSPVGIPRPARINHIRNTASLPQEFVPIFSGKGNLSSSNSEY